MKRRVLIKTAIDGYRVTTPEGEVTGGAVIRELSRDPACIPVFQVLRLVTTWAMERPPRRAGLLPNDRLERLLARIAGKLPFRADDPRGALACVLGEMTAGDPDTRRAAFACLGVADWALSKGAIDTALSYARAAALVKPDARYSWIAGRMHREHGRLEEAEVWFKVAYSIAGRTRDWPVRVRSLLSSGHAYMLAGNYLIARDQFSRALGIARRRKVTDRIGEAHHYLFIIAATTGDHAAAAAESHAALRGYGPRHERLPHFAHDLARYWMERGAYQQAEHVLAALLKQHFRDEPAARLLTVGSLLRAAGGAKDGHAFARYLPELHELGVRASTTPSHAQAFLAAAFGAVALQQWAEAEELLSASLTSAQQTHQRDTEIEAEELLDAVRDERNVVHAAPADSTIEAVAHDALLYLSGDPAPAKV